MFTHKNICRSCLTLEQQLLPISAIVDAQNRILDLFALYLNVCITEEDDLPQTICIKCLDKVLGIKEFHTQYKESEELLKQQMLNEETMPMMYLDDKDSEMGKPNILIIEPVSDKLMENRRTPTEDIIQDVPIDSTNATIPDLVEDQMKCHACDGIFLCENHMKSHIEKIHFSNKEKISTMSNSVKYPAEESSRSSYRCEKCDCDFSVKLNYDNHMKQHLSESKVECPQCNETFSICIIENDICNENFQSEDDLSHICPSCGLQLNFKTDSASYIPTQNGNRKKEYICDFCQKKFVRKDSLVCHIRTHTGEKPFKCEICSKRFTQKNALATHMTLHTGKTVKCPLCEKTFSRPSFLKVHNREHTNERPYMCNKCPKSYRQMTHLRAHQYSHFNKKPFRCPFCEKRFSQKSSLQQHLFLHTGKPFKCPQCSMSFSRPYRFRNHLNNAHNIYDDLNKYRPTSSVESMELDPNLLSYNIFEDKTEIAIDIDL